MGKKFYTPFFCLALNYIYTGAGCRLSSTLYQLAFYETPPTKLPKTPVGFYAFAKTVCPGQILEKNSKTRLILNALQNIYTIICYRTQTSQVKVSPSPTPASDYSDGFVFEINKLKINFTLWIQSFAFTSIRDTSCITVV